MASKPETTFTLSVHRHLPSKEELHREKMNNPYSSGTPDVYYSGNLSDLWCEYKFVASIPKRATTMILPDLSELQKDWLDGRHKEGRNVAVIVGCPEGGVIYRDYEWLEPLTPDEFRSRLRTRQELASWLVEQTTRRADGLKTATARSKSRGVDT